MSDKKAVATLAEVYYIWPFPHYPLPVAPRTSTKNTPIEKYTLGVFFLTSAEPPEADNAERVK